MAIIDELITLLGFESDSSVKKESDKYNYSLKSMTDGAAKLAAGVLAAQAVITGFVASFAATTDESGKFAAQIGISYESLQELEYAAQIAGGSVDELRGDLAGLAEQFGHLGSADNILLDMAEKMEGLSRVEQLQLGKQLGLSSGTLRLIAEGKDGIAALREEARALGGVLSEETTKDAAAFQDQLVRLDTVTGALFGTIAAGLLPVLTESSKLMTDFVVANQELIKSSVGQVIGGMTMGLGLFTDAMSVLISFFPDLEGGLDATRVIALAVAGAMSILAANMLIAAAPFIVIGIAIAAVIIILEDLWTAIQGGDSVIGDLVDSFTKKFPLIAEVIGRVVGIGSEYFITLWDVIKTTFSFITDYISTSIDVWGDIFSAGFQFIEDLLGDVSLEGAVEKLMDSMSDAFSSAFESIKKDFTEFFDEITDSFVDLDLAGEIKGIFTFGDDEDAADGGVVGAIAGVTKDAIKDMEGNAGGTASFVGQANGPVESKIPASIVNSTSNSKADHRQLNVTINGANSPENVTSQLIQKIGFGDMALNAMPLGGG